MKKLFVVLAVLTLLALLSVAAYAASDGPWTLDYNGGANWWSGQYGTVYYSLDNGASWASKGVGIGAFDMRIAAAPVAAAVGTRIWTYCVDLTDVATPDDYTRYLGVIAPDSTTGTIPTMTTRAWQDLAWLSHSYFTESVTNQQKSGGFQLAVWDVLFGNDYDLALGNFKSADIGGYGATYLTALSNARNTGFVDYTGNTVFYVDSQTQMGLVPEPGTIVAAMALLAPAGLVLRRRRK